MDFQEEFQFLKYCFQKRKDTRFRKNLMSMGDDFSLVNLVRQGDKKAGTMYYHIAPDATGSGFFADHNRLLCYLYYADYFGLCPVVEYGRGYSYAEQESVNGTTNPFEYYFEQPCGVELEELKASKAVLKSRKENAALAGTLNKTGNGYDFSEEYVAALGSISHKYVRLNKATEEWMQQQISGVLEEKKTLGVHVRGTDFKRNYKGHPVKVTTEEYLHTAEKLADEKCYEKIFLATDDVEALEKFKGKFGSKLVFYMDVIRSEGDETVMKSEEERGLHHYLLGREVLRDAWTLSSCRGIVAGLSQVSLGARILKNGSGEEYEDIVLLDKGMNQR